MRQTSTTGFESLMNDTLILVKQSGKRIDGIKASVQRGGIYTMDGTLPPLRQKG